MLHMPLVEGEVTGVSFERGPATASLCPNRVSLSAEEARHARGVGANEPRGMCQVYWKR